jgi:hypothetical protein
LTRIAITGHRHLPVEVMHKVDREVRYMLSAYPPADLVGLSCLADGADQLFAQAILDAGGRLVAIVVDTPEHRDYPDEPGSLYAQLLSRAHETRTVPPGTSRAETWTAAGLELLQDADLVFAVWDGRPPNGTGSTADVVAEARRHGLVVRLIWPSEM